MQDNLILNYKMIKDIPIIECYPEDVKNAPLVLVNHGTGGSAESMLDITTALARRGCFVVDIDAVWHGRRRSKMLDEMLTTSAYKEYYLKMLLEMAKNMSEIIDFYEDSDKADTSRVGMTGISQGGYVTFMTMTKDDRIKAAAPLIGSPDLTDKYGNSYEWDVYTKPVKDRILKDMPLTNYEKMAHTALLIQNSASDTTVPVTGTRRLDEKLRPMYEGSDNYMYLEYAGLGHECPQVMREKAVEWLVKKL